MSSVQPSEPSSAASTPRSEQQLPPPPHRWHQHPHHHDGDEEDPLGPRVRLMCSFGGSILPRPHDHQLRYVGGETRIVAVPRAASFSSLLAKLAKLLPVGSGGSPSALQVKYQLPHEDLDALISVTSDEDVEIMMEEHERLAALGGGGVGGATRTPRLRVFLFAPGSTFGSLHDGSDDPASRRERWFLDALNSGAGPAAALERGRSETSSVVSELPDYLFGLDTNSDLGDSVHRAPIDPPEPVHHASDYPESPVRRTPDNPSETTIPDLRPVKTRLVGPPATPPAAVINQEMTVDEPVKQVAAGVFPGSRTWQYMNEPVPVYFVPTSLSPQQAGPVPVPLHVSYGSSQPTNPGPVPVVYRHPVQAFNSNPTHASPVYVGGLPVAQTGPVGPYSLPVSVPQGYLPTMVGGRPYGVDGHGAMWPMAGIPPSREDLPDSANSREQGML